MTDSYFNLISIENLFCAWEEFKKGKRKKYDVMVFERNLEDNLFFLHSQLKNKTYRHGVYQDFWVNDPKRRHIHKAEVRDRVVHHLLYRKLYGIFDKTFIYDSYSCRVDKGTHRAVKKLERFARIVGRNYSQDCWALKLDIKQFFASVDHEILKGIIQKKVVGKNILWLIDQVIDSFTTLGIGSLKGIPLGNLTSQIFANIYLNELDQFIKHKLKAKYYLRYADDFLILDNRLYPLYQRFKSLKRFLDNDLVLQLHPNKSVFRKLSWGIDFCGYIVLPHYILPRTKTKRRIIKKIATGYATEQSLQSYLGYFSHASSYSITNEIRNAHFLSREKLN